MKRVVFFISLVMLFSSHVRAEEVAHEEAVSNHPPQTGETEISQDHTRLETTRIYGKFHGAYTDDQTRRQEAIDSFSANCKEWIEKSKATLGELYLYGDRCDHYTVNKVYLVGNHYDSGELYAYYVEELPEVEKNTEKHLHYNLLGFRVMQDVTIRYRWNKDVQKIEEKNKYSAKQAFVYGNKDSMVKAFYSYDAWIKKTCSELEKNMKEDLGEKLVLFSCGNPFLSINALKPMFASTYDSFIEGKVTVNTLTVP